MKKYIQPTIKVKEIDCQPLMDNSLDKDDPSSGLPGDNNPTSGGTATGGSGGDAGAKKSIWSSFDE